MSFDLFSSFLRSAWERSLDRSHAPRGNAALDALRPGAALASEFVTRQKNPEGVQEPASTRLHVTTSALRGNPRNSPLAPILPRGLGALLMLCLFLSSPAFAAVIKVTPDHEPVRVDESFNLEFSSEESVDDDPDFSPLKKDFEIQGQNQNSEISIINGKMTRQQKWVVGLIPKRAGAIPIPPIAFGSDHSQPVMLTVQEAGSAESSPVGKENEFGVSLQVEAEPKDPYVQAQVIYTVRLWIPESMRVGGNLNDPQIDNALVERLFDGNGRSYSTSRGGRGYTVVERKYAVFPQNSGLLHIEPLRLDGEVEVGGRSMFDRGVRRFRAKSEAIDLKVRSIPEAFTGSHWLPAAELKLEESWPQDKPQAKAGEPVTRTLTVHAQGATVGVLPELGADAKLDPSIKQYPDQPALKEEKLPTEGISSVRQEKAALIPSKAGEFKLPAVEIPWWNTRTERMETARIPERVLSVEASGEAATTPEPVTQPPQAAAPVPAPSATPLTLTPQTPLLENRWFWLALVFGLGWLATGLAWALSRRGQATPVLPQPKATQAQHEKVAHKALRQACVKHDPDAARLALLDWAKARWPKERPASLGEVAGLAGGALAEEITKLNRRLYSHGGEGWQGDDLWIAVQAVAWDKHVKGEEGGLEPLYR